MPKFTRKHYTAIAGLLSGLHCDAIDGGDMFLLETVRIMRERMTETFSRDNPAFKPDRFIAASTIDPLSHWRRLVEKDTDTDTARTTATRSRSLLVC